MSPVGMTDRTYAAYIIEGFAEKIQPETVGRLREVLTRNQNPPGDGSFDEESWNACQAAVDAMEAFRVAARAFAELAEERRGV